MDLAAVAVHINTTRVLTWLAMQCSKPIMPKALIGSQMAMAFPVMSCHNDMRGTV